MQSNITMRMGSLKDRQTAELVEFSCDGKPTYSHPPVRLSDLRYFARVSHLKGQHTRLIAPRKKPKGIFTKEYFDFNQVK